MKSTGLGVNAQVLIIAQDLDASGNILGGTVLVTLTGNQPAWVQLAGTWNATANAVYTNLIIQAKDLSGSGASANATVWLDNAQVWPTALNAAMPYCETQFLSAPAQVVLSGLQGDVPAPALLAIGLLPGGAGIAAGASLTLYAGRRSVPTWKGVLTGGALFGPNNDGVNTLMGLANSYSGWLAKFRSGSSTYAAFAATGTTADLLGVFHLLARTEIQDTGPTTQNVQALVYQNQSTWLGNAGKTDRLGVYQSPFVFPWSAQNTWTLIDAGQVACPPAGLSPVTDPTQVTTTAILQSTTLVTGLDVDWWALVPVDADLLAASFLNNSTGVTLSGWLWCYLDGLSRDATGQTSATWSHEATPVPNLAHAGGAPGTLNQNAPAINPVGDSVPLVDPTQATTQPGVNQWVIVGTDNAANLLPIACRVTYAPLWLTVR